MGDLNTPPLPPVIATGSLYSISHAIRVATTLNAPSSGAWGTANLALYLPLVLPSPYLVRRLWWANGTTAAGNVDVGVYTLGGARVVSSGATAQAGTSVIQSTSVTELLAPGSYYLGISASATTTTFLRYTLQVTRQLQMMGIAQQATAHPLPATATLAVVAGTLVPIFGIASAGVI